MDPGDRLAIHELMGLYGHLIDERRWAELHLVFTDDVTFDATDFDMPITTTLEELVGEWTSPEGLTRHPLAHHCSNVVVTPVTADRAEVASKGIGVGAGGRVGSVTYDDVVVKLHGGWRISSRRVLLRRG